MRNNLNQLITVFLYFIMLQCAMAQGALTSNKDSESIDVACVSLGCENIQLYREVIATALSNDRISRNAMKIRCAQSPSCQNDNIINNLIGASLQDGRPANHDLGADKVSAASSEAISISPGGVLGTYDFGSIEVGQTASQTFTISNTGTGAVTFKSGNPYILEFTSPTPFSIASTTCGSGLAASASCTVTVNYAPTISGSATASLTININESDTLFFTWLKGEGRQSGVSYNISIAPGGVLGTYDFGSIEVGQTASQTFTISNTGTGAVTFKSGNPYILEFTSPTPFSIASTTCGSGLAASASCTVTVNYVPAILDSETASLTANINESSTLFFTWLKGIGSTTPQTYILAISKTGNGTITSSPAGINCGSTCNASFSSGTSVTLTPSAGAGYSFTNWTDACSGSGTCTVTMDGAKSVSAIFTATPVNYTLTVSKTGNGTITSSPAGINCGSTCNASFSSGTSVTLTPSAGAGYSFTNWTGACSGSGTCTVTMDGAKSVSAIFTSSAVANDVTISSWADASNGKILVSIDSNGISNSAFTLSMNLLYSGNNVIFNEILFPNSSSSSTSSSATGSSGSVTTSASVSSALGNHLATLSFDASGPGVFNVDIQSLIINGRAASFSPPPSLSYDIPIIYSLFVSKIGNGTITSSPAGINCGSTCSASFNSGTSVALSASPDANYIFSGWTGDCSGTGACVVMMNSNKNVTATFTYSLPAPVIYALSAAVVGNGTITSSPTGISCGSTCSASFNSGTSVTLSATPDANYIFAGWSGDCSGTGACVVTLNSNKNVSATFTYSPPAPTSFNLAVTKTGSGTVSSQPSGIDCGSTCSGSFSSGATITLVALPENGFEFSGWSGACSGAGNCSVLMDGDKAVSANFVEVPTYAVTVTKQSGGVVSSEPQGIVCGGSSKQCKAQFSSVNLTATPNAGYEFIKWTGCQSPEGNVCSLQPTNKTTVKAVFKALPKYNLKVTKNTLGSVTSDPAGLKCPDKKKACTAKFTKGTQVTLTPVPQAGRSFTGWTGACSGLDACTLVMDGSKGVGAIFQ